VTAWVILIGFAALVVGVVVKIGVDLTRYLREDREEHGGRQTVEAARRAWLVIALVAAVILLLIVFPLLLGDG
jgi:uncharacterized membrane protein